DGAFGPNKTVEVYSNDCTGGKLGELGVLPVGLGSVAGLVLGTVKMAVNQDPATGAMGTCPVDSSVAHEVEIGFSNLRPRLRRGRPAAVLPFAGVERLSY